MVLSITASDWIQQRLGYRKKPRVLQMPITSKCNSRCLTCNVWRDKSRVDIPVENLKQVLSDSYFSKVESVGINGGEPTLHCDIDGVFESLFVLPSLKSIYLISNSINSHRLLSILERLKSKCSARGLFLSVTISLDGIGEIHNHVRGVPNSFDKTAQTISELKNNRLKYCDKFDIGCTVSKHNVFNLAQIDEFCNNQRLDVFYHLAVPNRRIFTFDDYDYSVITDEYAKLMATEFFYGKYISTKKKSKKIAYFINYNYLKNARPKRHAICNFRNKDLTIDENLNLYYCAVASRKIGNLVETPISKLLKSTNAKSVYKDMCNNCDNCIHYASIPNLYGLICFLYVYLNDVFAWRKFKYLKEWLR